MRTFGGKGANAAVAISRQRVPVHIIGCVGDDTHGMLCLRDLEAEGVMTHVTKLKVLPDSETMTGTAFIIEAEVGCTVMCVCVHVFIYMCVARLTNSLLFLFIPSQNPRSKRTHPYLGANKRVCEREVRVLKDLLSQRSEISQVIFYLEIPYQAVLDAARVTQDYGRKVVLKASPLTKDMGVSQAQWDALLAVTDVLVMNDSDAAVLLETE